MVGLGPMDLVGLGIGYKSEPLSTIEAIIFFVGLHWKHKFDTRHKKNSCDDAGKTLH